jgi:hypothetical protein
MLAPDRIYATYPFHYPAEPDSAAMRELREKAEREATKRKVATVGFEAECRLTVPAGLSSAQVLLLVQVPGRIYRPSSCSVRIDDKPAPLRQSDSSQHTGYFMARKDNFWKALLPYDSEWCWYICQVPEGSHRVRFEGASAHPETKIGVWLWSEADVSKMAAPIGLVCGEPAMPQWRAERVRTGLCLRASAR